MGWTECGGERERHELDDDVKILGALETTLLLVEHEDWPEHKVEEKLQLLLGECGWSLTDKEGKAKKGSNNNRRRMNTGDNKASDSEYGGETQNETQNEVLDTRTGVTLVK